ncbi:MAG: hypothetical protein ACI9FG_001819, partial [Crocinitomicaceae bacterium]
VVLLSEIKRLKARFYRLYPLPFILGASKL